MYKVEVSVFVKGVGFTNTVEKRVSAQQIRKGLFNDQVLNKAIFDGKQKILKHDMIGYHFGLTTGSYTKRNKVEYSVGVHLCN